ncbi:MAG: pilus assembly protein TadG-related protein [Chloroflexota bacterium]
MSEPMTHSTDHTQTHVSEEGQTIVLMVFMIVALLALVGLAADVGFLFARSSQFSSAVDSAALAGVVEMDPTLEDQQDARERAAEFLTANGWPVTGDDITDTVSLTAQGIPQYTITLTWPVETFFMGLIGFGDIPVTRAATAVYYAQAEIYTPSAFKRSQIRQASQFILGPDSCSKVGEPASPEYVRQSEPNADSARQAGLFRYRIRVTSEYTPSSLRVELFDPDSVNVNGNSTGLEYTNSRDAGGGTFSNGSCSAGPGQPCVFETGENLQAPSQNPYWFVRVDENYAGHENNCDPLVSNPNGNNKTEFALYYYDEDGERTEWATYTDNSTNFNQTDMKWVTPGYGVSVDSGSPQSSFDVDLNAIPKAEDDDETQYIYLDVKTTQGSARNVWDIAAGPPDAGLPTDVNERNLVLANNPSSYRNVGISTFAVGRMPLQAWVDDDETTLTLAPIDSSLAGTGTIYSTVFDYDMSHPKLLEYTINTVWTDTFRAFVQLVGPDAETDPANGTVTCDDGIDGKTCDASWWEPQVQLGVPGGTFYGGDLQATYTPRRDAHTWSLSVTSGAPILTR